MPPKKMLQSFEQAAKAGDHAELKRQIDQQETSHAKKDFINAKDAEQNTALHLTVSNNHYDATECLLKYSDLEKETKDQQGRTALHIAAFNGDEKLIQLLLKYNAAMETEDNNHNTALYIAAYNCRSEAVGILLSNGANLNALNYHIEPDIIQNINIQIILGQVRSCLQNGTRSAHDPRMGALALANIKTLSILSSLQDYFQREEKKQISDRGTVLKYIYSINEKLDLENNLRSDQIKRLTQSIDDHFNRENQTRLEQLQELQFAHQAQMQGLMENFPKEGIVFSENIKQIVDQNQQIQRQLEIQSKSIAQLNQNISFMFLMQQGTGKTFKKEPLSNDNFYNNLQATVYKNIRDNPRLIHFSLSCLLMVLYWAFNNKNHLEKLNRPKLVNLLFVILMLYFIARPIVNHVNSILISINALIKSVNKTTDNLATTIELSGKSMSEARETIVRMNNGVTEFTHSATNNLSKCSTQLSDSFRTTLLQSRQAVVSVANLTGDSMTRFIGAGRSAANAIEDSIRSDRLKLNVSLSDTHLHMSANEVNINNDFFRKK